LYAGIKACKEILSYGIPYPKLDQVYYFLGVNYDELDDRAQSLTYFDYLTRKFPNSVFVGDAYREIGDDAYEKQNYRKAQAMYEQAAAKTTGDTRARVLHKLAWSYYRTKQFDHAVDTMKQAIAAASQSGEKFLSLREEALRDMAIFMTETGRVDEAITYFQSVSGDKTFYPRALEKLGKQYERNVEPGKAIQVYESLLKTNPETEAAFRVLVKLVDLDLRRGHTKEALARVQTPGVKIPSGGEDETKAAVLNLKAMIRRTAIENHETYRKTSSRPALETAEAYYTANLNLFLAKDDPHQETPEIEMYLAEVKHDLGKSQEASELYRAVVESKDKRYAKEAGALWTASLADSIKKSGSGKPKTAEPSELEKEFIDAADRLNDSLPDSNEAREASLKAAEVLAGYKSTQKDAIKRISHLIEHSPKSTQALIAARLWLQILADDPDKQDDLKELISGLEKNTTLLAADQDVGSGRLKASIEEQELRMKIGKIATQEHQNDFGSAGQSYEALAAEAKTRTLAEKAYANGLSSYFKANDTDGMERIASLWLKKYPPQSPSGGQNKAIEAIRNVSTNLLIQGRFDAAARFFERLGEEGGDPASLETAGRVYEGNGDAAKAQSIWSQYLAVYSKSPYRWRVALELGRSQDAGKQDIDAIRTYESCMNGPPEVVAEAGARLGDLHLRAGSIGAAKEAFKKVAAIGTNAKGVQTAGVVSPFVAYARYRLADLLERERTFAPLSLSEEELKKGLSARLEFLEALSRAYGSAVEAGGPFAIAALDREARWVMNFAQDMDQLGNTPGSDAKNSEKLKAQIDAIVLPLRKKALTTWTEAYQKAVAGEIYSPALPDIADQLASLKTAQPVRAQGSRGRFRLAGVSADGGADGSIPAFQKVRESLIRNPQDSSAWTDYGNLLWGAKRPLLAKIAYERALSLNPKNAAALNNRGVIAVSGTAEENWYQVAEGSHLFDEALAQDSSFLASRLNKASLQNYYRLFSKSEPLWERIVAKGYGGDAQDGLGVAQQGNGNLSAAEADFKQATAGGLSDNRFVNVFNEAARKSLNGVEGATACDEKLSEIDSSALNGFEKSSFENLKRSCGEWKIQKP
jgi:tetratricopeptide (TPR) repeat protein